MCLRDLYLRYLNLFKNGFLKVLPCLKLKANIYNQWFWNETRNLKNLSVCLGLEESTEMLFIFLEKFQWIKIWAEDLKIEIFKKEILNFLNEVSFMVKY